MCKIKGLDLSFLDFILSVPQFAKKMCQGGKAQGKGNAQEARPKERVKFHSIVYRICMKYSMVMQFMENKGFSYISKKI